jgi:hypothetical protein
MVSYVAILGPAQSVPIRMKGILFNLASNRFGLFNSNTLWNGVLGLPSGR